MKRFAELVLASATRIPLMRSRMSARVLILAYHNVTPPGCESVGERSVHITWQRFIEHLDLIERTADVVPLASLLDECPSATSRPRVVLTFDDAYAGAVEYAIPEVSRRMMSATVFVPPGFIGGRAFWWDCLADPASGALNNDLRNQVLLELGGDTDRAREWAFATGRPWNEVAPYARACTDAALKHCAALPGVTFGGHTWSHPNLLTTDPLQVSKELDRCREWERQFASCSIPAFAFPYGNWSTDINKGVRDAGYHMTLMVNGGWCAPDLDFRSPLPRLNVPAGLSVRGLELRLRGIFA